MEFDGIINNSNAPEADAYFTPDVFDDTYLSMELAIPRDRDGPDFSKVTKLLRDKDGLPIGRSHNNPILDTRMYEVEYKNVHKAYLEANAIAENKFFQVDGEGNQHTLLQDIVDHKNDGTEVKEQDVFITTRTGTKCRSETTKVGEVLLQ